MCERSPNSNDHYLVPEGVSTTVPHGFVPGAATPSSPVPPQPQSNGYRRRRRLGYGVRYLFASARTLPFLTLTTFLLTILGGMIYWCSQPLLWEVDAAIIVAEPKADEFLNYLNRQDHAATGSMNQHSISPAKAGFRFLSPRDVGDLLTTPALVQKAEREILRRQQRAALAPSATQAAPLSPIQFLARSAFDLHQRGRAFGTAFLTAITAPFRTDNQIATIDGAPSILTVDLLPPAANGEKVLRLRIAAGQPELAEAAAEMLVEVARNRLSEFESSNALEHLHEQEPRVAAAQLQFAQDRDALAEFQNTLAVKNPAALVATLERRLTDSNSQTAQLETDTTEAETERLSVGRQLDALRANGEAFVIRNATAGNPRIGEMEREISSLQSQYDALVDYTDQHPEKLALQKQIKRKQAELQALPASIIVEEIREPNPIFVQLSERRLELDRNISQLAGRAAGLQKEERSIRQQLVQARADAATLNSLQEKSRQAQAVYAQLSERYEQLITSIAQSQQFQHLQVMETPIVRSRMLPDSPRTFKIWGITLLTAIVSALIIPMFAAAWRARAVSRMQLEVLANELPIVIVGELPKRPSRKLLPARITTKTTTAAGSRN